MKPQTGRLFRIPPLYAILDAEVAGRVGWTLVDLTSRYLAGGARFFQIRAKHVASGPLLDTAKQIVALVHGARGIVIMNDRADLARLSGADGVHLGQDDLSAPAARSVVGLEAILGVSTHTAAQLDAACRHPVTYVAIGPVFGTATKSAGYDSVGLDMVRQGAETARLRGLPLVAIGGITLGTAADVVGAGAASVAVISDLLSTGDPEARVRAYLERLTV